LGKSHLKEEEIVVGRAYKPLDTTPVEALPLEEPIQKYDTGKGNLPLLLVVEDNEDMRLYLREIMSINYKVIEAFNGENGLDFALEHTPDLIISDVMMPSMDGHQLCQKLKTDERTSHIPVILLTARAGEEAKLEGLETGADDYITKPFSPVELRARVQNLIELRQKLREKFEKNLFLIPNEIQVTSIDKLFLQRAYDILEIHRSDPEFNSDVYAREVGMSRSQLHRKLKALTNYSTGEFIRLYRLNYARELLCKNFGDIAQVSYECGF
jgi:DNA-binding response OmpR family regulator